MTLSELGSIIYNRWVLNREDFHSFCFYIERIISSFYSVWIDSDFPDDVIHRCASEVYEFIGSCDGSPCFYTSFCV